MYAGQQIPAREQEYVLIFDAEMGEYVIEKQNMTLLLRNVRSERAPAVQGMGIYSTDSSSHGSSSGVDDEFADLESCILDDLTTV